MADTRRDVPKPPASEGNWITRMWEEVMRLMGRVGDPLDRAVRVRDLTEAGIASYTAARGRDGGDTLQPGTVITDLQDSSEPDLTPPPTPTGLTAAAGFDFVLVQVDQATYTQGHGPDKTNLYAAQGLPSQTATITIASPAVVTLQRPVSNNQKVNFTTTGALPTGVSPGVTYYAVNASGLTCQLSLTQGGAAINTTGSQSGVHTAVYAPVFSDAVKVAEFRGTVYSYPSNPATEWHFWAKWQTVDGVLSVSPAGGTNGVVATTAQDVRTLLDAVNQAVNTPSAQWIAQWVRGNGFYVAADPTGSGSNTISPVFTVVTSPFTQNGVSVPVGVYFQNGYIQNGSITTAIIGDAAITTAKISDLAVNNAKIATAAISTATIQDAAITNAKIHDLAADKITAGTLDAARIGAGTIDATKINVSQLSAISATIGTLQTSTSGQRSKITDNGIQIYNSSNVEVITLGIF